MAPTVQVSDETRNRLAKYKEASGAATYDEAISRLLGGAETESAFGSIPGWRDWTPAERLQTRSDDREA